MTFVISAFIILRQQKLIVGLIRSAGVAEQIQQLFHSQTLLSLTIEIADGNGKNLLFG